jgi:hypothetical protein
LRQSELPIDPQHLVVNRYRKRGHRIYSASEASGSQLAKTSASINPNNFLRCNPPRLDLSITKTSHQADQAGAISRLGVEDIPDDKSLKQRFSFSQHFTCV